MWGLNEQVMFSYLMGRIELITYPMFGLQLEGKGKVI